MANLRRAITPQQGLDAAVRRRRAPARWLVIVGITAIVMLALAWIDGGETPLRPISEQIELPEQPQ